MRSLYQFKKQDVYDFANFVNTRTKISNGNLHFEICPYCKSRKDKYTFGISLETGQFLCQRASCGAHGNMLTLASDFDFSLGSITDEYYKPRKHYRKFKQPDKPYDPKPEALKFLESRGISEEVAKKYEITVQTNKPNVLVFPFYDDSGEMCFIKYRNTEFNKEKGGNKEWCEANGKPILFGMKQCTDKFDRLIITEGQLDSLAVATAGIENAVSVPTGAKGFTWLPYCWDWLNKWQEVVIFGDYEKGEITLLPELSKRLKTSIRHVREEDYKDCKDANDILRKYGKEQVRACVENAVMLPVNRVIQLADVKTVDIYKLPKMPTGIKQIDKLLRGGIPFGGVTLISGKTGEGKLLADDTPVFTESGWKKHGDLKVGDRVIGRDGKFVKVTHVFPKSVANMKITLSNHEAFYCHENHEWVLSQHGGNGYKERILTTKEISEKRANGYKAPLRIISRKPLDGTKRELYVKPYTLGAWLGDGRNQHPDICSSKMDYCVIERIINKDEYEVSWQTTHKTTGVIYTGFDKLGEQLKKYGMCHSRKRLEKHIPHEYLIAPLEDRLELLAGLLDTDGYYDANKHAYTYATCDIALRDTFIDLIHTFGWTCSCRKQDAKISTSGIIGRRPCYSIGFVPIGLFIPCVVKRKQQNVIKDHSGNYVTIRDIEPCEPVQGNCIEVEGGIYCVGKTMIPTHNSTLASQIMISALKSGYKCFAYSGELANYQFQSCLNFQIAGGQHIMESQNPYGDLEYGISNTNIALIKEWYRDRIWIYDNTAIDGDEKESLITTTENVIMQYGVNVILLDNLMTALDLEEVKGSDKYERQGMFVKELARLAQRHDVLILLVAHKRKNNFSSNENDEIMGSSDISNLAMVTIAYERGNGKDGVGESQRICKVSKNRLFGKINTKGWILDYDEKSKRIYGYGDDVNIDYGWNPGSEHFIPIDSEINEEIPFEVDD